MFYDDTAFAALFYHVIRIGSWLGIAGSGQRGSSWTDRASTIWPGPWPRGRRPAAAAKCKKIKDKKKRKTCLKKARAHNAGHDNEPQPECTTGEDCDDGLFCNGEETCGPDGTCQPGTPPSCDDDIPCTVDTCDEGSKACLHVPDHGKCGANAVCDPEQQGCVCENGFEPCGEACVQLGQLGSNCDTGQLGSCAAGVRACDEASSAVYCQRTHSPTAETCNGLDDDCAGEYDEELLCPTGQRCENGGCCTENGSGPEHDCTNDDECCSLTCSAGKCQ